jgi:hypothetical protein
MDIRKEAFPYLAVTPIRIINECGFYMNIYKERGCIGEIAETGIVWHHWQDGTIILKDSWLTE